MLIFHAWYQGLVDHRLNLINRLFNRMTDFAEAIIMQTIAELMFDRQSWPRQVLD